MQPGTERRVFARSWELLAKNFGVVVPGLAAGVFTAIAQYALVPWPVAPLATSALSRLLLDVVQIVAAIVSISYTTGMADAAWETGHATLADGARAFSRDGRHVLVAMLALIVLGVAAASLVPYTLALSLVAYAFLCIYTMASAVVGERPGVGAVIESAEIAFARPLPTLLLVLGIAAVAVATGIVGSLFVVVPLVGPLLAAIILEASLAYVVLVVVGEYRSLRGSGALLRG